MQSDGVLAMSAFSESISKLCASTDQVSQLCRTLLDLNAADSAVERLESLGAVIGEICDYLDLWLTQASSGNLPITLLNIRLDLEEIFKIGTWFRVVATLTAMNANGTSAGMNGFIEELSAVPDQIKSAVSLLMERLKDVDTVVADAVETAETGLHFMIEAKAGLQAQSGASQAVFQTIGQARQGMERVGNRFLNDAQDQTKALMKGFQYSDFFAQRLDHVAHMPAWESELGPSVRLLAARQLAALAEHGETTVREIETALQAISQVMDQFMADFARQGDQGAAGNGQLRAIFANVLTSRDKALPRIVKSAASSRKVLAEIQSCNQSFERLVEMSGVMDMAAINARIRASREDNAQLVMAFLSRAVIDGAQSCRDVLAKSSEGVARIAAIQDEAMLDRLIDGTQRFTAAFDVCQAELDASGARVQQMASAVSEIARLIDTAKSTVQDCRNTASDLTRIIADMKGISQRLAQGIAAPATWPDMSAIYDSYTIQAERDTHDLLIGREVTVAAAPALAELDDVFF